MPEKNKIYKTKIDSINNLGYGVCRIDGMVCFVKGGVTGDTLNVKVIKVNKSYCIGRPEEIFEHSKHRVEQLCPAYKFCGGCTLRHLAYEHELEIKKSFVEAEFKKVNLDIKINDVVSAGKTERYRNKAQYPVDSQNKIGFYAERSHTVYENSDCILQPELFAEIIKIIKTFLDEYKIKGYDEQSGKGILRHIYIRQGKITGETHVCLVINGSTLPHSDALVGELKKIEAIKGISLNINTKNTNVILGEKYITLFGQEYIEDELCGLKFRISPASFYQINHDCAELLYNKVIDLVKQSDCTNVADLYCGTGTIGLCVANRLTECNLTGVEIVPEAIENARINAEINGIKNAKFICADSTDTQNGILQGSDVVILDPPRKGITQELADKISESGVKNIVYVSCSPDTLARDVKYFTSLGYTCDSVTPYDMFPRTGHIENVCAIKKL